MKKLLCAALALCLCAYCFCQNADKRKVVLKITNVKSDKGTILVSVHDSEKSFKARVPVESFKEPAKTPEVTFTLSLAPGEYAFCVYHDVNCNGDLDTGLFGIPKEPFGFSNYDGKSPPGKFERHKVFVSKDETITIPLVEF
ncbi:MAG: DUF2141 domain-containing protein [Treponema sp.]|nr:DUF2141 domain-containing protein [Treponema sp.]